MSADDIWTATRVAATASDATDDRRQTPRPAIVRNYPRTTISSISWARRSLHFIGSWTRRGLGKQRDAKPPAPHGPNRSCVEHVVMHIALALLLRVGRVAPPAGAHELGGVVVGLDQGQAEIASVPPRAARRRQEPMWVPRATELVPAPRDHAVRASTAEVVAEAMYKAVFDVTPHVMGISCDECFADVTGLPVDAERLGEALRASILRETSGCRRVGIGPNRLLARARDGARQARRAAAAARRRRGRAAARRARAHAARLRPRPRGAARRHRHRDVRRPRRRRRPSPPQGGRAEGGREAACVRARRRPAAVGAAARAEERRRAGELGRALRERRGRSRSSAATLRGEWRSGCGRAPPSKGGRSR